MMSTSLLYSWSCSMFVGKALSRCFLGMLMIVVKTNDDNRVIMTSSPLPTNRATNKTTKTSQGRYSPVTTAWSRS